MQQSLLGVSLNLTFVVETLPRQVIKVVGFEVLLYIVKVLLQFLMELTHVTHQYLNDYIIVG